MPGISMIMIKPASSLCNMRCRYCFYADETANRQTPSYGVMTEETLEAVLDKVLSSAAPRCTIAFQGGEPTKKMCDRYHRDSSKEWETLCFRGLRLLRP